MVLTCHVISQDCMAQEPSDFFGRSTSRQVTNLLHLVAICCSEDITFLV